MTKERVRFTVSLTINEGKLESFEAIAQDMVARSEQEAGTLAYEFFLSGDKTRCRLIEEYADADAVLVHINGPAVQQLVPKMLEVSKISGFEVYGDPGPEAAAMLKGIGAEIFEARNGFTR